MRRAFVQTGIAGLDAILGGGIPRGNVVLITGGPGSGKTSLGVEFVYRGARDFNEPGMIVTFEVSTDRLIEDASSLGWDLQDLQNRGSGEDHLDELRRCSGRKCSRRTACSCRRRGPSGRDASSSMASAGMATNGESMPPMQAGQIFRMLIEGLYHDGTTAMFTLDAPAETAARGHLSEEFIADTIVRLGLDLVNRHAHRSLEIVKSRGHNYMMGSHSFKIVDQQGLVVYPRVQMPRVRRVDSPALGDLTARITTGVEGLDGLLERRLLRRQHHARGGHLGHGQERHGTPVPGRGRSAWRAQPDGDAGRANGPRHPERRDNRHRSSGRDRTRHGPPVVRIAAGDGDR